jgi:hypothetical protein
MTMTKVAPADFWRSLPPPMIRPDWLELVRRLAAAAEARRVLAAYNTGSILEQEAYLLLALADHLRARVVIEVGTFIGFSTTALAAARTVETVYTCDASNDCLQKTGTIRPYPKLSSTQMLTHLRKHGVCADLCFFDGVVTADDVELLLAVTNHQTVYAVHDYNYGPKIRRRGAETYLETMPRKGIGNVRLLQPHLPTHVLVEPYEGTTLALLVPEARL